MAEHICAWCQTEFIPTTDAKAKWGVKTYCSCSCAKKMARQRAKDRGKPEGPRVKEIRTCEWCGVEFPFMSNGRKGMYCTQQCAGKANGSFRRGTVCEDCGDEPYRSRLCHFHWKVARSGVATDLEYGECRTCSSVIVANHRVYCSAECRRWKPPRCCKYCDKGVLGGRSVCDECRVHRQRERVRQYRKTHPRVKTPGEKYREHQRRRGARVPGVHVDPPAIFARDNYTCQLCNEPLDMEVPWDKYNPPHFYPTIDHILPIDLGGKDTPPNVQAAHWVCNVEKGNGLHEVHNPHGEQLRLVG